MASKPAQKEPTQKFTVDTTNSGVVDMPSVTRLLNRKKLGLPATSKPEPAAAPATPELAMAVAIPVTEAPPAGAAEPGPTGFQLAPPEAAPAVTLESPPQHTQDAAAGSEIPLSLESPGSDFQLETTAAPPTAEASNSPASAALTVQRVKPRSKRPTAAKLALWNVHQLRDGSDPLGKGLTHLLGKGAQQAVFLSITAPAAGSSVPHFVASAALASAERVRVWTGLRWDPAVVAEAWNLFVRAGYLELPPPGTNTNAKSTRNVIRAAFGIARDEWLLLVRVGPAEQCRGILGVVSKKSLLTELSPALAQLNAALAATKKAG